MKKSSSRLVYSSEFGRVCPECSKPVDRCLCHKQPLGLPPSDGVVRVGRETKGRKGKGMTLITGVPLSGDELKKLVKELKQKCGTGGTLKGGVIEIQGDHRDVLVELLKVKGWVVKRSGG